MTTLAGFPIYRALGIPFIVSSIRTGDVELSRSLRCRLGFNRASLVIANSQSGLESAGVSSDWGRVIRNGFDFSRVPTMVPSRKDHRFTIVKAARMASVKDHVALIAAVRILLGDLGATAVRCVLLGDGPGRAQLESDNQDLVHADVLEIGSTFEVTSQCLVSD